MVRSVVHGRCFAITATCSQIAVMILCPDPPDGAVKYHVAGADLLAYSFCFNAQQHQNHSHSIQLYQACLTTLSTLGLLLDGFCRWRCKISKSVRLQLHTLNTETARFESAQCECVHCRRCAVLCVYPKHGLSKPPDCHTNRGGHKMDSNLYLASAIVFKLLYPLPCVCIGRPVSEL